MLRLLTMCIPFRNLRKKGRAFLRDFLSDYDRNPAEACAHGAGMQ